VTAATPRTYWLGAISSWGIDLVKRGYEVATLTSAYGITYGNAGNAYDLGNFDVFIVPEPNTVFSAAESTAIFNFVREGGGLVAVADHINYDRNGDGIDSPRIWNQLDAQRLWGVSFEVSGSHSNFTEVWSTNVSTDLSDSTIYGPEGTVNGLEFHDGTTMTLYPAVNPTVRGSVWRNGFAQGKSVAMAAPSVYGNGRIFFVGDRSPLDTRSPRCSRSSLTAYLTDPPPGLLMGNPRCQWRSQRSSSCPLAPRVTTASPPFREGPFHPPRLLSSA